jgi:hypothetical protein
MFKLLKLFLYSLYNWFDILCWSILSIAVLYSTFYGTLKIIEIYLK